MTTAAQSAARHDPVEAGTHRHWLVACDLDQTLIFSPRSFRLPEGVPAPPLTVVEHLDGEPAAFATPSELASVAELARAAEFVPVTTRTLAQYSRVDLGVRPRYAVAANGGHLLVDGMPDEAWAAQVRERLARTCRPLHEVARLADRLAADGWVRVTKVADDLFVYLVAYERDGVPDLTSLSRELVDDGWSLSVQGRKVYLVPRELTKQAAIAEAARRAGTTMLAAAGDSLLDRDLLAVADVAVRPAHGELHELGWHAPNLSVTRAAGVLGGQELAARLLTTVVGASAV